jgi:hypothetical protein
MTNRNWKDFFKAGIADPSLEIRSTEQPISLARVKRKQARSAMDVWLRIGNKNAVPCLLFSLPTKFA